MRTALKGLLALCFLVALPIAVMTACTSIPSPSSVGCSQAEEPICRGIIAASILDGATVAVDRELTRQTITPQEARRILDVIAKGRDALKAYRVAIPLTDGTLAERLDALDAILLQVVQAQAGLGG